MLKLREPIQLHSIRPFVSEADGFAQRIIGNYELLGAHITPKELLFALNSPPEAQEQQPGMTTIAVQNTMTDQRTVVMDVVNNVVNRILLSESPSFTYQDTVYLETALRKLGIEDVKLFLSQTSRLQQENRSLSALFQLYRQERAEAARGGSQAELPEAREQAARPQPSPAGDTAEVRPMYQEIFQRLSTASIYQTMASYMNALSAVSSVAEHRSLQMAEQNWSSRYLTVQQQYRQRHQHQELNLFHTVNRYETPGFPELPQQEEQVLTQAAAAALFSSVSHVMTQRLSQEWNRAEVWQDLRQSLSETVENTISRFENSYGGSLYYEYPYREGDTYQTQTSPAQVSMEHPAGMGEAVQADTATLPQAFPSVREVPQGNPAAPAVPGEAPFRRVETEHPAPAGETENAVPSRVEAPGDETFPSRPEGRRDAEQAVSQRITQETIRTETQTVKREALESGQPQTEAAPTADGSVQLPELRPGSVTPDTGTVPPARMDFPAPPEEVEQEASPRREMSGGGQSVPSRRREGHETVVPESRERPVPETLLREIHRISQAGEQSAPAGMAAGNAPAFDGAYAPGRGSAGEGGGSGEGAVPVRTELAVPPETAEGTEEVLIRKLREIDRRNREAQQRMERIRQSPPAPSAPPVPDRKRVMSDALRAVNAPEEVIREILEAPPARLDHPKLSPEAELFLSQTDSTTREILRTALAYQDNPQAAAASGRVQPGNLAQLNLENRIPAETPERVVQQVEEQQREITQLQETRTSLLEEIRQAKAAASPAPAPGTGKRIPPVRFIHKQEAQPVPEEDGELFQQRNRTVTQTENTTESVVRQNVRESEIHSINNKVVAQSAEDIQALVNRTLSKQMNTITERVYQQMEKRLQTERFRRGRF